MAKKYGDYKKSVELGNAVEEKFMNALKNKFKGCNVYSSTKWENQNKHIDVKFILEECKVTFDVKSEKKVSRSDSDASKDFTWVELQNNFGGKGWLYGSEKYIAFEWDDSFIIVDRKKLLDLTNTKKIPGLIFDKDEFVPYCQYQRKKWGNNDICVLTPIADIIEISHMIIKK